MRYPASVRLHAGEAVQAGTAQHIQQYGLGLVVHGVARHDTGWQYSVPGSAGPGFEVGARRDHNRPAGEAEAEVAGGLGHKV